MAYIDYEKKLRNPKWQKKRLEILQRDNFTCRVCGDSESELQVHHIYYHPLNKNPWDYSDKLLITLCDKCHKKEHEINLTQLAEWYFKHLMALTNTCLINMEDLSFAICDESENDRESLRESFKINILRLIQKS